MKTITLTINPALDIITKTNFVTPKKKTRCSEPIYEPGGGGVNVSRALKKLGDESVAYFLGGGPTGELYASLLESENVQHKPIISKQWTRENLIVYDETLDEHYRFGMPGSKIDSTDWQNILDSLAEIYPKPDYLVASGSLPPGVTEDFYSRVAEFCVGHHIKLLLDTSDVALKKATDNHGVFLIKPNYRELEKLAGHSFHSPEEMEEFLIRFCKEKKSVFIIVSLGAQGAIYADENHVEYILAPSIRKKSAVGAGDSMLAGVIHGLNQEWPISESARYGVAAGSAAAKNPGTALCNKADTDQLFNWMNQHK